MWGSGFYSHHPWVLKPMAWMKIFQGITLNAKRCSHGLPNMLGCFMDFLVGLIWFDWGSMKIMKSELSPFCVFFQRAHPTLPYLFPPQTKTQQNIQNLKWDVRDVRSVDFPLFCHILEVTLHLNPCKGHLTIPKRSQRIARSMKFEFRFLLLVSCCMGAFFSKSGFIPNRPAQNATVPKTSGLCQKAENKRDHRGCFTAYFFRCYLFVSGGLVSILRVRSIPRHWNLVIQTQSVTMKLGVWMTPWFWGSKNDEYVFNLLFLFSGYIPWN